MEDKTIICEVKNRYNENLACLEVENWKLKNLPFTMEIELNKYKKELRNKNNLEKDNYMFELVFLKYIFDGFNTDAVVKIKKLDYENSIKMFKEALKIFEEFEFKDDVYFERFIEVKSDTGNLRFFLEVWPFKRNYKIKIFDKNNKIIKFFEIRDYKKIIK